MPVRCFTRPSYYLETKRLLLGLSWYIVFLVCWLCCTLLIQAASVVRSLIIAIACKFAVTPLACSVQCLFVVSRDQVTISE